MFGPFLRASSDCGVRIKALRQKNSGVMRLLDVVLWGALVVSFVFLSLSHIRSTVALMVSSFLLTILFGVKSLILLGMVFCIAVWVRMAAWCQFARFS